jgi:hypothetical protein
LLATTRSQPLRLARFKLPCVWYCLASWPSMLSPRELNLLLNSPVLEFQTYHGVFKHHQSLASLSPLNIRSSSCTASCLSGLLLGFCWSAVPGKDVTKGGKNVPGLASCLCLLLSCLQVDSVALKSELKIGSVLKDLGNALYSFIVHHLESSHSLLQCTLMFICCKDEV